MSLTKVYLDILTEINNNPVSINILVEKYKITTRAVRYYIDNINYYLQKYSMPEIYIKNGKLYFSLDNNALIDFFKKIPINEYLLSQDERKKYILFNFLFKNNITISRLERFLNVSRTTIKNDINDLKEYLDGFELYFYIDANKIILGGKEKKLRHLKFLNMIQYINIESNKINYIEAIYPNEKIELNIIKEYISQVDINIVNSIIIEVEKKFKSKFSNKFKNIMSIYLIATLERIQNNHIIKKKNNADFLIKLPEYKKIKIILNKFLNNNNNYQYEILHLTEYFLSEYYNEHFYENKIISEKFILKILECMNISLEEELTDELMRYITPAIYRIKNNFCIDNKLNFDDINIDLFNKIKKSIEKNIHYLKEPLREEEIYYIYKIIENYIYPKEKISLKKLIKVIDKNHKDKELLIKSIKNKFAKFINNDIENDFNLPFLLKKKNILINNNENIDYILNKALNNLAKEKSINNNCMLDLKNLVKKFGEYFFIKENIFFLSNIYSNSHNIQNQSTAYLIISKNPIKINNKTANIIFIVIVKNKIEHLKIISQIMKLSESNNFQKEIINQKSSENIISVIEKYYNK